ncbi:MAG: V-type ATP synthase subunit E [Eubacterium sp.]|jgi:V/A-type H+-transporting ATPase subunit E
MTGLDKIKERIEAEARDTAQEKLRKAGEEADAILGQASADAEKTKADSAQKSQAAVTSYRERIASAIDIQRRNKILAAKQQMIGEVLKEAEEKVASLDDEAYFDLIARLIENCVHAEAGELFLSEKDLSRVPSDFGEKAAEIAKAHGGSLTLSKKPADIKNGCVLVYGGIEENCTLDAIFSAKKDELSDLAVKILFS